MLAVEALVPLGAVLAAAEAIASIAGTGDRRVVRGCRRLSVVPGWLYGGPVVNYIVHIGKEIQVGTKPKQTIPAPTGDLGKDPNLL